MSTSITPKPMPAAGVDQLAALLDGVARYAPEYRNGLSNHLPMALTALQRLGASAPRLAEFSERHALRLEPAAARTLPPPGDWQTLRARPDAFPALLAHFGRRLAAVSAEQVLDEVVPALLPGAGAGAFHGLLRTAYAWEARHLGELAIGLAYWACRWLPLTGVIPSAGHAGVGDWLRRLSAWQAPAPRPPELIVERMARVAAAPGFAAVVDGLRNEADTPGELADAAAHRYLATRDFTVLHLVTSAHALHMLRPFIGAEDVAWRWYALAYAAAWVGAGTVQVHAAPAPGLDWPEVTARALIADDEHVIKLVYTCREMAGLRDPALYHEVARTAVSR